VGNRLFFSATDGTWNELWATADGTTLNRVTSINPNGPASPGGLVNANGRLFFSADDGVRGTELWEFDVVTNRERFVADLAFGSASSLPFTNGAGVFDGHLYFNATDGVVGNELWRLSVSPVVAGRGERDFNGDGVADVLWRDAVTGAHAVHLLDGNGAVTAGRGLGGDLGLTIAATGDFNGDGVADIIWRNAAGSHTLHLMNAAGSRTADRSLGLTGFTLEATGDYNGDGKTDIVWRNVTTGVHSIWLMNGVAPLSAANLPPLPSSLRLATTSGNYDADGDGKTDLVWRSIADGSTALWRMNGTQVSSVAALPRAVGFALIGTGDFDGDGRGDLLWRNDRTGATSMWLMNDAAIKTARGLGGDKGLQVVATGDYNGDGKTDLVWRNAATGVNTQWLMNGATRISHRNLGGDARRLSIVRAPGLPVMSSGPLRARESDFNGDGISDLVWRESTNGAHAVHVFDSGGEVAEGRAIGGDLNLSIVVSGDFNGDGVSDRIWRTGSVATGTHTIHLLHANGSILQDRSLGLAGFTVVASGDYNGDGRTDLMWRNSTTGAHSIWLMNGTAPSSTAIVVIPTGWQVFGLSGNYDANGDGKDDVLLRRASDGTTVLWRMNGTQVSSVSQLTGALAFTLAGVGDFDGDGRGDLIWRNNSNGRTSMWLMNDSQIKSTHLLGGDLTLQMVVTGDYNGDGRTDLVWRNTTTGANTLHLMDGPTTLASRRLAGTKTLLPLSAAGRRT
jgi:ELWxxDGT repeat protein